MVQERRPLVEDDDADQFNELFRELMNTVVTRNLMGALECGESIAALDSREKQKAFCNFAACCIRKIFMLQQNLRQIADVCDKEYAFYADMAAKCPNGFCVKVIANIEKVVSMIDRNVSSKILFCDLVNRMFMNI